MSNSVAKLLVCLLRARLMIKKEHRKNKEKEEKR